MAVPDPINDFESFKEATEDPPRQLAGVYFFFMLDCLIELANRVAHDFFDRPHLYTDVSRPGAQGGQATIAPTLAKLHARYGSHEEFLATGQRDQIYSALLGSRSMDQGSSEDGDFARLRDELLDACATFAETKFGDVVSLRENVRQKHRLFNEYVRGQQGHSLDWTRRHALGELTENTSYTILRNGGVARVFTGATAPRPEWPYDFDSNADKLIEEISKQLMWPRVWYATSTTGPMPKPEVDSSIAREVRPYITREDIVCRQRAALEGAVALATIIDVDASSDQEVDVLITRCYTWRTALKCLRRHTRASAGAVEPRAAEKRRGALALGQSMSLAAHGDKR
jgi:hypothetical protein